MGVESMLKICLALKYNLCFNATQTVCFLVQMLGHGVLLLCASPDAVKLQDQTENLEMRA